MPSTHRRGAMLGAVGLFAVAVGVLAVPPAPAFAHNSVIDQAPEEDGTVTAQPGTVWLETNDALLDVEGATVIEVVGPDGRHYATDCSTVEGAVASVPVELGPEGEYTVEWRLVSADGHPIAGEFPFAWTPADGEPVAEGEADAVCDAGGDEAADSGEAGGGSGDGDTDAAASGGLGDLLWVVGAAVATVLAGVAAFVLTRRRTAPGAAEDDATTTTDGSSPPARPDATSADGADGRDGRDGR